MTFGRRVDEPLLLGLGVGLLSRAYRVLLPNMPVSLVGKCQVVSRRVARQEVSDPVSALRARGDGHELRVPERELRTVMDGERGRATRSRRGSARLAGPREGAPPPSSPKALPGRRRTPRACHVRSSARVARLREPAALDQHEESARRLGPPDGPAPTARTSSTPQLRGRRAAAPRVASSLTAPTSPSAARTSTDDTAAVVGSPVTGHLVVAQGGLGTASTASILACIGCGPARRR